MPTAIASATLNAPAASMLLTTTRQNIIRLHNHPLFSGAEKRQSVAYLEANRDNLPRLEQWRIRLATLVTEREEAMHGQKAEQDGYYDNDND